MASEPSFLRRTGDGVCEIRVRVVPGAARSEVTGVLGDRLKVRVAAPAEAGRANRAVLDLFREWLGVRDVEIVSGRSSRNKTLRVRGIDADAEGKLRAES